MPFPSGHAQAVRAPRRLTAREKWMIGAVLVVVGALIAGLAVALATPGHRSAHGCLYLTIPAATGAQEIYQCGAAARAICASAQSPGSFSSAARHEVIYNCRRAGLAVGR